MYLLPQLFEETDADSDLIVVVSTVPTLADDYIVVSNIHWWLVTLETLQVMYCWSKITLGAVL